MNKTALLDAEIINWIAGVGKATQRQVSKNILAPETTVRYRLRKLVENGRLDWTVLKLDYQRYSPYQTSLVSRQLNP